MTYDLCSSSALHIVYFAAEVALLAHNLRVYDFHDVGVYPEFGTCSEKQVEMDVNKFSPNRRWERKQNSFIKFFCLALWKESTRMAKKTLDHS